MAAKGKGKLDSKASKVRFAAVKEYTFKSAGAAKLPATCGNDGVGVVTAVGSGVSGLAEGDAVVPVVNGLGELLASPHVDAAAQL